MENLTRALKMLATTKDKKYWGPFPDGSRRGKSYATKQVDRIFKQLSIDELRQLSPENKKIILKYLADDWYYPKYNEKRNALNS